jgi:hypothetical protein
MIFDVSVNPNMDASGTPDKIVFTNGTGDNLNLETYYKSVDYTNFCVYTRKDLKEQITFVIQGRILDAELFQKNLLNLCRYGHIVVSLTKESVETFVKQNKIINDQNVYLQVQSTLDGLKKCTSNYSIKVRADEYYLNWDDFISKMVENPDKIITNNVFFRKVERYPFHISDHIIGGLTENMVDMFRNTKRALETKRIPPHVSRCIPEQWLTVGFLLSKYTEEQLRLIKGPAQIRETMIAHFHFVRVETFEDFVISYTKQERSRPVRKRVNGINDLGCHRIIDVTDTF